MTNLPRLAYTGGYPVDDVYIFNRIFSPRKLRNVLR